MAVSTPQEKVAELRDEITELLRGPCFDDIMIFMLASNLKDGKVWANYQCFKDFFRELRYGGLEGISRGVRDVIVHLSIVPDIDHSMSRIMGRSGLFSYTCNVRDDYLYMSQDQWARALENHGKRMSEENLSSMVEIARQYGALLESIGR